MVASACTTLPGVWHRMRCAGNPGMCEFAFAVEASLPGAAGVVVLAQGFAFKVQKFFGVVLPMGAAVGQCKTQCCT